MHQPGVLLVKRVLIAQLVLTSGLTIAAVPFGGGVALSILIGASACVLATVVFALRVFRRYSAQRPEMLVMRFYGAEVAKLALVLGLFTIAFATVDGLSLAALLAAYFVVQVLPTVFASNWGATPKRER